MHFDDIFAQTTEILAKNVLEIRRKICYDNLISVRPQRAHIQVSGFGIRKGISWNIG